MILQFGIYNGKYVTLESLKYKDIEVPSGFEFDGVTVMAPFTLLFSTSRQSTNSYDLIAVRHLLYLLKKWRIFPKFLLDFELSASF